VDDHVDVRGEDGDVEENEADPSRPSHAADEEAEPTRNLEEAAHLDEEEMRGKGSRHDANEKVWIDEVVHTHESHRQSDDPPYDLACPLHPGSSIKED
jgi:hypothetical protein